MSLFETLDRYLAQPRASSGIHFTESRSFFVNRDGRYSRSSRVAHNIRKDKIVSVGEQAKKDAESEEVRLVKPCRFGRIADEEFVVPLISSLRRDSRRLAFGSRILACVPAGASPVALQTFEECLLSAGYGGMVPVSTIRAAALGTDVGEEFGTRLVVHLEDDRFEYCWLSDGVSAKPKSKVLVNSLDQLLQDGISQDPAFKGASIDLEQIKSAHLTEQPAENSVVQSNLERLELGHEQVLNSLAPIGEEMEVELRAYLKQLPIRVFEEIASRKAILTGVRIPGLAERLGERLGLEFHQGPFDATAIGMQRLLKDGRLRNKVGAWTTLRPTEPKSVFRMSEGRMAAACLLFLSFLLCLAYLPAVRAGIPTPVDKALSSIVEPVQNFLAKVRDGGSPSGQAEVLAFEKERRYQNLVAENKRLSGLLGRKVKQSKRFNSEPVVAKVVSRSPDGWLSHLTLDKGSKNKVKKGMIVSSRDGLVGEIVYVSENRSRCRLFIDTNVVLAADVRGRRASGVVVGGGSKALEMHYLQPNSGVQVGDIVVTSGQDETFPQGLKVAKVSKFVKGEGSYQSLGLVPLTKFGELREVLIVGAD